MEEIREAASAYYNNLPNAEKQTAINCFKAMDKSGKGKVSQMQYLEFFRNFRELKQITNPDFFKIMDKNGDGWLDFEDFITVFYLWREGKVKFCEGCRVFITGLYFSCVQCFNSGDIFNICSACHSKNNIDHLHQVANFVDNSTLEKQKANIKVSTTTQDFPNTGSTSKRATTMEKIGVAMAGLSFVNFSTNTAPELCEKAKHAFGDDSPSDHLDTAQSAFNLSDARSNVVQSAFNLSDAGSNSAQSAFYSSDYGSNVVQSAFNLSDAGSNSVQSAFYSSDYGSDVVQSAFNLSDAGSNDVQSAFNLSDAGSNYVQSTLCSSDYGSNAVQSAFNLSDAGSNTVQSAFNLSDAGSNAVQYASDSSNHLSTITDVLSSFLNM